MQIKDAISFYHENKSIEEIDARNSIVTNVVAVSAWAIVIACLGCIVWLTIMVCAIDSEGTYYTKDIISYSDTQGWVFCGFFAILAAAMVATWIFVLFEVKQFGQARSTEKSKMQTVFTVVTLTYVLEAIYMGFQGHFYKFICPTVVRWWCQDWLLLFWDFVPMIAIVYLQNQSRLANLNNDEDYKQETLIMESIAEARSES